MISLIIPVYNAENTIKRCINSIKNQTYDLWEAILVDDASTDSSVSVLRSLTQDDSRFHIYEMKKNSGPAAARNFGLSKSSGEWISFIDSDDEIDKDCLLVSIREADESGADVVMWGLADICEEKATIYQKTFCGEKRVFEKEEMAEPIRLLYTTEGEDSSACLNLTGPVAKLIRATLAKSKRFPENINLGEDTCYIRQVFDDCNKMVYFDRILYFRYIRGESLSSVVANDWKRKTDYINWMIKYDIEEAKIKARVNFNQILYRCLSEFVCFNVHIVPGLYGRKIRNEILQCRKALICEIDFSMAKDRSPFMVHCIDKGWYYLYKVLFVVSNKFALKHVR